MKIIQLYSKITKNVIEMNKYFKLILNEMNKYFNDIKNKFNQIENKIENNNNSNNNIEIKYIQSQFVIN